MRLYGLNGGLQNAAHQHNGTGDGQGDDEVEDRTGGALDEDGFQRLDVGDSLHAGDGPFFAVSDPHQVHADAVEPVHHDEEQHRLPIGGGKVSHAVPHRKNKRTDFAVVVELFPGYLYTLELEKHLGISNCFQSFRNS